MSAVSTYKASMKRHPIEIWQAGTSAEKESIASIGIIGSLFDGLTVLLKHTLNSLKRSKCESSHYRSLEANLATLFFWGRDFGVSHGELDLRLQHSDPLRDTVLAVLVSIGECLSQVDLLDSCFSNTDKERVLRASNINTLLENARVTLEASEKPAQYAQNSTEELCATLQTKIECLNILSSSLECPAEDEADNETARTWEDIQDRSAHEYFADLVSSRFPRAGKRLVESLGRSNWIRYKHVRRQREKFQDDQEVRDVNDQTKSVFHDSGLGSSAPPQSVAGVQHTYAATVVSSRAEASHKRLPALPEQARSGKAFKCEVCDRMISIRRTKEWRSHIFRDICAYTCILSECSMVGVLFEDYETMANHLESQHGSDTISKDQVCPLCAEKIFGGRDSIVLHFARHMEEISLAVLPHDADSEDISRVPGKVLGEGDDSEKPDDSSEDDSSRHSVVFIRMTPPPVKDDSENPTEEPDKNLKGAPPRSFVGNRVSIDSDDRITESPEIEKQASLSTESEEAKGQRPGRPSFLEVMFPKSTPLKRKGGVSAQLLPEIPTEKPKQPVIEKPKRLGSWGRPKSPKLDTAINRETVDTSSTFAVMSGPWYRHSQNAIRRSRSRSDLGKPPVLAELMTQHGGPPMPELASPPGESEQIEAGRMQFEPENIRQRRNRSDLTRTHGLAEHGTQHGGPPMPKSDSPPAITNKRYEEQEPGSDHQPMQLDATVDSRPSISPSSSQGRRYTRSSVRNKARTERPWSTSEYASKPPQHSPTSPTAHPTSPQWSPTSVRPNPLSPTYISAKDGETEDIWAPKSPDLSMYFPLDKKP